MQNILLKYHIYVQVVMISLIGNLFTTQAVNYKHPYDGPALEPLPFQASFEYIDTSTKLRVHFCSGSIISELYVVSAAHCFLTFKVKNILVVVGSNRVNLTRNAVPRSQHTIAKLISHKYFQPLHGYDIALIRVSPKFKLDGVNVEKIALATKPIAADNLVYLPTVGRMKPGTVHDLQLVSFRTMSMQDCISHGYRYVSHYDICAYGYAIDGRGACDGDSGSGLLSPKMKLLIGLLSYGRQPCETRRIYVFTGIWFLHQWIEDQIKS